MAREFLARQGKNRTVSPSRARAYQRAMERGEWLLSPHGLVFDESGHLTDGQHRCKAIIGYGKPVLMVLVFDVPADVSLHAIDAGRVRTIADRLSIDGHGKGAARITAIVRCIANAEHNTNIQITLKEHHEIVDAFGAEHLEKMLEIAPRLATPVAAAAVLARPLDTEIIDETITAIITGNALLGTQAALSRLCVRPIRKRGAVVRPGTLARIACRGMVAILQGEQMESLQVKSDGYKELMGMRSKAGLPAVFLPKEGSDET
jgi:hypothetical protein